MFVVYCAATPVCGVSVHMPLLAELVSDGDGFCYKHGAPKGALLTRQQPIPPKSTKHRSLCEGSVPPQDEAVVHAAGLVEFERGQLGQGRGLGFVEDGLG